MEVEEAKQDLGKPQTHNWNEFIEWSAAMKY